ncbi:MULTISPECIES: type II toxin-antitoxin system RelE/ParE family toxin [unclassified Mannheimia]|uniref:type II toxin-antitoxin system RelE/ParE family toxin n=1 Tax=unclassified Mannheimia TaxID=2645054 RepID=UPI00359E8C9D
MKYLTFIELQGFSKHRQLLMNDEEYRQFQLFLLENYTKGRYIQNTGGCQKIRWAIGNKGKSGGVRVIYYVVAPKGKIYLLLMYAKNEQANLTTEQRSIVKKLVEKLEE